MDYMRLELSDGGLVLKKFEGSVQDCNAISNLPDCNEEIGTFSSYKEYAVMHQHQSVFIHTERNILKSLYNKGILAALSEYYNDLLTDKSHHRPALLDQAMSLVSHISSLLKADSMKNEQDVISTYQWQNAAIKCLSWHPQTTKLAVAYSDHSVRLYSDFTQTVPHLRHRLQHNVTAIAWKPFCSSLIAIGCKERILIWNIDARFLSARPNSSTVQILEYPGHSSISSLCWSPDSSLLISSSSLDNSLHLWRLAFDSSERLTRPGRGCHHLSYSPDSKRLACLTVSNHVRLWDTSTWTCDQWAHGTADMWTACCWSADSVTLLLTQEDSSCIYSLSMRDSGSVSQSAARPLIDLEQALPQTLADRLQKIRIYDLQWDRSNSYLAVLVSASDGVSFVVIFTTYLGSSMTWDLGGFKCVIEGEMGKFVTGFSFLQTPSVDQTILTVAWLKGEIRHIKLSELDSQQTVQLNANPSLYSTINS